MGNKPADYECVTGDPFKIPEPDPLLFKLLAVHPHRRYESLQLKQDRVIKTKSQQELPE